MAQAAFAPTIAFVATHRWNIDDDARECIDWVRFDLIGTADEYFDTSPSDLRKFLYGDADQLQQVLDRLPIGADHDRLNEVRERCLSLAGDIQRLSPDQWADRIMVAASLLVTGTEFRGKGCPFND
ncbi:MAG: hypothetical protein K2W86_16165 [Sphingomonas sp.]|uniref:hypothetical protein n=1 Tax=Sphingomonas sp. TaxID=28214 RepID=UPI0035A934FA|nr:hypothetical protein [Sphingomonas sp.]